MKYFREHMPFMVKEISIEGEKVKVFINGGLEMPPKTEVKEMIKEMQKYLELADEDYIKNENNEAREFVNKTYEDAVNRNKNKTKYKEGIVYLLKSKEDNIYKIGVTTNMDKRLNQLTPKLPFNITVENKIKHKAIYKLEKFLHNKFENKRVNGEWFRLDKNDVNYIKNEAEHEEVI